jgi:uncharacterized protein (TIGR02145 family)
MRVRTTTDPRDETLYPTMGVSGTLWLANDLYYKTRESWCYKDEDKCGEHGRLYSWEAAKKACLAGWHLPTETEWFNLIEAVGGYFDFPGNRTVGGDPKAAYTALTTGSFSARLGGSRTPKGEYIDQAPLTGNGDGMYWTSSSCGADSAAFIVFNQHSGRVMRDCEAAKGWAMSVRCTRTLKIR